MRSCWSAAGWRFWTSATISASTPLAKEIVVPASAACAAPSQADWISSFVKGSVVVSFPRRRTHGPSDMCADVPPSPMFSMTPKASAVWSTSSADFDSPMLMRCRLFRKSGSSASTTFGNPT